MGKNYHKDAMDAQISALEAGIFRDQALLGQLRQVRDAASKQSANRKPRKRPAPAPAPAPASATTVETA